MDYYRKALAAAVYRRALSRQDWAPCTTLQELMQVAILAAHQEEAISFSHRPPASSLPLFTPGVKIPQDPIAMEISAVNSHYSTISPRQPTKFPFKFYRELCQACGACWHCQKAYDEVHRSNKAPGKPFCTNPQATTSDMDAYCVTHTVPPPSTSSAPCSVASTVSVPTGPPAVSSLTGPSLLPSSTLTAPTVLPVYSSHYPVPYHYLPHMHSPLPVSTFVPGPAHYPSIPPVLPVVPSPTANVSSISTVFSEYQALDEQRYYDLPPSGITEMPPSPSPHSIAALTFTNPGSSDPRLILRVMLILGKRILHAKALINPGSTGDFLNSRFADLHGLSLSPLGQILSPVLLLTALQGWGV